MFVGVGLGVTMGRAGIGARSIADVLGSALLGDLWAERTGLMTTSGSNISSLTDAVTGSAFTQGVTSPRPKFSPTSWRGVAPGWTFDGVDDRLDLSGVPYPTGANPSRVWILADQTEPASDTAQRVMFAYGGGGTVDMRWVYRSVNGGVNRFGASATNVNPPSPSVDFSGIHVGLGVFTATENRAALDGTYGSAAAVTQATGTASCRIGAYSHSPVAFAKCVIRRILIDDGSPSAEQDAAVRAILNADGGIS